MDMENLLIEIFEDTQKKIQESNELQSCLRHSQELSQLYHPGYTSALRQVKGNGDVVVVENTTFQCAREIETG